jgi:pimeloyl-ACP methyl ester carboxylesterase
MANCQVAYVDLRPERSETVVMIHGFRGSHDALLAVAHALCEYRVIVPDLPGNGRSDELFGRHTPVTYAYWLDRLLDAIGIANFTTWGHSYGGAIALVHNALGRRRPKNVIAVSPALPPRGLVGLVPNAYYSVARFLPEPLRTRWLTSRIVDRISARVSLTTSDPQLRRHLTAQGRRNLATLNSRVTIEAYLSGLRFPLESVLSAAEAPTLIVGGARDRIVKPYYLKRITKVMPNAILTMLANEGHLSPLEAPLETAHLIRQFLMSN